MGSIAEPNRPETAAVTSDRNGGHTLVGILPHMPTISIGRYSSCLGPIRVRVRVRVRVSVVGTHSCRYCALSGLGGRDIAGGVCFKNPTGGDFRRTVVFFL